LLKYGREEVMKIVEETIIRCHSSSDNNNTPPLNIMEVLITAPIDENIGLDCVFFLLRRQPDFLVALLSSSTPAAPAMMTGSRKNNNEDGDDDEGNDGKSNAIDTRELNSSKKRKRKL
jgi:hypothetical protein